MTNPAKSSIGLAVALGLVAAGMVGSSAFPSASAADPTTVTLSPIGDSHVYSGATTTNYGTADHINSSASAWRGLLKFDTGTIPVDATIASADLKLTPTVSETGGGLQIHPELTTWQELAVTWANQPTWNPTIVATSGTPSTGVVLDTPLPTTSITPGGETDFGMSYSVGGLIVRVGSRESTTPPQLVVTYTAGATTTTTSSSTTTTTTAPPV